MLISILKIIGIVLLCIIGLALLISALVLFVPLRYAADFHYHDRFKMSLTMGWLFNAIKFSMSYDDGLRGRISVLGIKLMERGQEDETDSDSNDPLDSYNDRNLFDNCNSAGTGKRVINADEPEYESVSSEELDKAEKAAQKELSEKSMAEKEAGTNGGEAVSKPRRMLELFTDEANTQMFKRTMNRIRKSVSCSVPKELHGQVEFGTDDPALTGKILVWLAFLYPIYGEYVKITPYFDRYTLNGDLDLKGHFSMFFVGFPMLRIWLDKDFQRVYNQIIE